MKKTTWVIIGLAVCVMVLATALGIVLLQNLAEKARTQVSASDSSDRISSEVRQMIDSFSIDPRRPRDSVSYFYDNTHIESSPLKRSIIVGHSNYMYGVPVRGKGLTVYRNGNVYTYTVSKEK